MQLFSRSKAVYRLLMEYMDSVGRCHNEFVAAIKKLLAGMGESEIEELADKVDKLESVADEKRHNIIRTLLDGALLPESRREILKLIEMMDEVANNSEGVIRQISLQRISFHNNTGSYINKINSLCQEQFALLRNIVEALFNDFVALDIFTQIQKIELLESRVDELEEKAIKELYGTDIHLAEKNQLREILTQTSDISDVIEDITDIIEIIMVLRKV